MRKIKLEKFFKAYSGSPHHLAAVHLLEDCLPKELLDKDCDWVVCFEAESEADPQPANYNINK
tara:strand:- start:332 stop:520 length:189 start_codon:yes stop_codon:yes gene_type:complete